MSLLCLQLLCPRIILLLISIFKLAISCLSALLSLEDCVCIYYTPAMHAALNYLFFLQLWPYLWDFSVILVINQGFEDFCDVSLQGKLDDGREIAVKKLSHSSNQGKKEFENEAKLLARVQHRNVVNLLGYCAHGAEKLLIYEYVINESLDKVLFSKYQ